MEFECPTCGQKTIHIIRPEDKSMGECTICFTIAGIKQKLRTPDSGNHKNKLLKKVPDLLH